MVRARLQRWRRVDVVEVAANNRVVAAALVRTRIFRTRRARVHGGAVFAVLAVLAVRTILTGHAFAPSAPSAATAATASAALAWQAIRTQLARDERALATFAGAFGHAFGVRFCAMRLLVIVARLIVAGLVVTLPLIGTLATL